ncbi:transcription activator for actt3 protein [Colletotrichum sojae]|uniref:Transcription activator for actt3 protein n=1 Tax=Colletotrichum sojae TaxID=2175907 RepID=A0A8H6IY22_9PEZI|nr:transcription activator for actt3 protein [Colletotrichum sojae]
MNTDFDFDIDLDVDVDMMMRLDTSAKHQLPIPPPTSQVEMPTKPPSSTVGQLEDVWDRLFASNAKLAKHGGIAQDRAAGRHSHSRLPLDLLLFLDEVVHQTISAVLSCGACSREPRVRLTLYLIVDWLADVLRATLETDLLRPSSSHEGLEAVETTRPGGSFAGTANPDKDANSASKTAMGKTEDLEDDSLHETNRLQLGSFRLEGELWQICIRELLKTRLSRLSRTVERIRGSRDRDEHHNRVGCIRTGLTSSSLDKVLGIMMADVYSKIEFLFGMIELWEA